MKRREIIKQLAAIPVLGTVTSHQVVAANKSVKATWTNDANIYESLGIDTISLKQPALTCQPAMYLLRVSAHSNEKAKAATFFPRVPHLSKVLNSIALGVDREVCVW